MACGSLLQRESRVSSDREQRESLGQGDDPLYRDYLRARDDDIFNRTVIWTSWQAFNLPDDLHTVEHFAEDHMLAIQPGCGNSGKEEL